VPGRARRGATSLNGALLNGERPASGPGGCAAFAAATRLRRAGGQFTSADKLNGDAHGGDGDPPARRRPSRLGRRGTRRPRAASPGRCAPRGRGGGASRVASGARDAGRGNAPRVEGPLSRRNLNPGRSAVARSLRAETLRRAARAATRRPAGRAHPQGLTRAEVLVFTPPDFDSLREYQKEAIQWMTND